MVSTVLPTEYKTVIVLDNDECLGSWSLASGIHSLFYSYVPTCTGIPLSDCMEALKKSLVKHYFSNGGARTGTNNLLKLIKIYKDLGFVDHLSMFTSASNKYEWVVFLKDCLEEYATVKGLYDSVFHRDNIKSVLSSDGSTLKSMTDLCSRLSLQENNTHIIIIDDKPQNIRGSGVRVAVSQYRHVTDEIHINTMIDEIFDYLENIYSPSTSNNKTHSPMNIKKMVKDMILVNKSGRKQDVYENIHIHKCPLDQRHDTNLIEQTSKAFINHILPPSIIRSVSEKSYTISHPLSMKRSLSS